MITEQKAGLAPDIVISRESTGIDRITRPRSQLMRGNFAFRALDPRRLASMQGDNFDLIRYTSQLPEVVKVADPDSPDGWRYKPVDGHHRIACHPNEEIEVSDITLRLIGKKYPGQEYLTSLQFLDEVRDPTEAQVNVASNRMALHFITEWRGIVGEAAGESSGLAAIVLLGITGLHDEPENVVQRYLARNNGPLLGENEESRPAIVDGLLGLHRDIAVSKKAYDTLALKVFQEVAALTDSQEDDAVRRRQISGLFTLSEVGRKVTQDSSGEAETYDRHSILYDLMSDAIPRTSVDIRENTALREALMNPSINYNNLVAVLTPPQADYAPEDNQPDLRLLSNRYDEVRRIINTRNLINLYTERHQGEPPSNSVIQIMGNVAGREILGDKKLSEIVPLAQKAGEIYNQLIDTIAQLEQSIGEPFSDAETIQMVDFLTVESTSILQAQTLGSLRQRNSNARRMLQTVEQTKLSRQDTASPADGFSAATHEPVVMLGAAGTGVRTQGRLIQLLEADNHELRTANRLKELENARIARELELFRSGEAQNGPAVRDRNHSKIAANGAHPDNASAGTEQIIVLRAEIDRLKRENAALRNKAAWWMVVDLTPIERAVVQAYAERRRPQFLLQNAMEGSDFNAIAESAFAKKQIYDSHHPPEGTETNSQ